MFVYTDSQDHIQVKMATHAEAPHWTLLLNALRELTAEAEERHGLSKSSPSECPPHEDGEQAPNHDASSSDAGSEHPHGFRNIDLSRRAVIAHKASAVQDRMLRNDPEFSETVLGYRDFEHFALMAGSLNMLAVSMTGSSWAWNQCLEAQSGKDQDVDVDAGKDKVQDAEVCGETKEVMWVGERVHIKLMPGNLIKRGERVHTTPDLTAYSRLSCA